MKPVLITLLTLLTLQPGPKAIKKYAVYYGEKATYRQLRGYDLLVLDSHTHPPLKSLKSRGTMLLGYISLGELESYRPDFQKVKDQNILLKENDNWKGSYMVDVRDRRWTHRVIDEVIPQILRKGFHGVFLDTLDNPFYLESQDPVTYKGMREAAIHLVRTIRMHYPDIKIMLNRGYAALDKLAPYVDMIMAESLYARYSFEKKAYIKVPKPEYKTQMSRLQSALRINPKVQIFSLDYCKPDDRATLMEIYKVQRKNGFIPYVATLELKELVKEPK